MPTPFSPDDLSRFFDASVLRRGRSLILLGSVTATLEDGSISVAVDHLEARHTATVAPSPRGDKVVFPSRCSCGQSACLHIAAGALAALDRYPALRKPERKLPPGADADPVGEERHRLLFELSPSEPPHACYVETLMVGERTGVAVATTPARILADRSSTESSRIMARLLGSGETSRNPVAPASVTPVLGLLSRLGRARWQATQKTLVRGEERAFQADVAPEMPEHSAIILGDAGPWYVDAETGALGRVRLRQAPVVPRAAPVLPSPARPIVRPYGTGPRPPDRSRFTPSRPATSRGGQSGRKVTTTIDPVIREHPPAPVLRLRRTECPDESGHLKMVDALTVEFDYDGILVASHDDRQFLRVHRPGDLPGHPSFVRRNTAAEAGALDVLRQHGLTQMRVADPTNVKGQMVFVYRTGDATDRWQTFVLDQVPALEAEGWQNKIERVFLPRAVAALGDYDVRVTDAEAGKFSLDFGVEVDGTRIPLLPILSRLLERGGIEAAKIVDDEVITSLDDGRILKLPAERIRRLLAVMSDLIESASRLGEDRLLLSDGEAETVLGLEDLLTTRWENATAIEAYAEHFRHDMTLPTVAVPASFTATLRPYQQQGVNWLQHLRSVGLNGFLADDMGLGKTAQTIAHIVIEEAEGRLDQPVLIVVPTSLVANWTAELAKFAPHLGVVVLHGVNRHERRADLTGIHVVVTTYTVLTRDIEAMKQLPWHLAVLDEAQVIKSPDAMSTKAVCQLTTRHRLCLSGTPIENNLQELWSEFAFLMPGLLGDRKGFAKRFRRPIEKDNDPQRRAQLIRRIKPFLMRRTKAEVATDLPPKHTILRRIDLAADQRELYDTIRGTLYDKVRKQVAELTTSQSRIVMLDALLKLRQVCCDPRLVKLPSARLIESSSKLDELLEMITEMIPEGRRILLFSQFTTMLDLIKPRLVEAGIEFAELRGDTRDRAEPVRTFESGAVSLFLISLKAGGRGLNLTSADTVIHYDPWWNPAAEDQASDRAHRIGQTKPVFVYKLIAADTVEDRIVELQRRKANLANIALSEDEEFSGVDVDDVEFLFGSSMQPEPVAAEMSETA
ncbi:DEAD/DEAH box helicase [Lichenicola cladoniae]|uniref:DEAD/DEAH box helicase n=1 Tax=Lichenicola cladoniae TaxID=1484109 RepID=A0A6M8HPG6_9PROT|nr:DEAD/DEAH box helicase [Lichenicola cladoniae]NPD66586.1 DEAD/DEAH box helicase [Acetobacteraceae bacterium]QKE90206.1 DEAD/DEAH box helicase [Lichenicola cladoniae]